MLLRPIGLSLCLIAAGALRAGDATPPLPSWLELGAEIRGRLEAPRNLHFCPGQDDAYYLSRLRLRLTFKPASWFRLHVQGQDARAPGHNPPVPTNTANPADLRQAYAEFGRFDQPGFALRAGRQEIGLDDERLLGVSNWSNVGRSFDALRLAWSRPGVRLDAFTAAPVLINLSGFDRPHFNNKFHGVHASFDRLLPASSWQLYLYLKSTSLARGERGGVGAGRVYTTGLRGAGRLPRRFDYRLEVALQTGHLAADTIRAWAAHSQFGYSLSASPNAPRLVLEYNQASGDRNPADGVRGTFDQLYATNHVKYGIADIVGWRNMRDAMQGRDWRPHRHWKLNFDLHSFWLDTRADYLYGDTGAATVRYPAAVSAFLGRELDLQLSFQRWRRLPLGAGAAHVFPAGFLRQSTSGAAFTTLYLMWVYIL
jgi:hypothetical protein